MSKHFNKYGAAEKNQVKFDSEIITEYKGQKLPDDLLMIRCYSKKDECHVLYQPNYETKEVGISLDRTTPFSDAVLTWLINSGTAEKMLKEIHQVLWGDNPNVIVRDTVELPKLEYVVK